MNESLETQPDTSNTVRVIYVLYLVGLISGITAVVGVILAYLNRDQAPPWLRTHYQYAIRTFWISLLYLVIGGLLSMVLIGVLVLLFWVIWLVVRMIKGFDHLQRRAAIPNPNAWGF